MSLVCADKSEDRLVYLAEAMTTNPKLRKLIVRQKGICALCGEPFAFYQKRRASVDHIVPRSYGGSNNLSNLQAAHIGCNNKRGNLSLQQFRRTGGNRHKIADALRANIGLPSRGASRLKLQENISSTGKKSLYQKDMERHPPVADCGFFSKLAELKEKMAVDQDSA